MRSRLLVASTPRAASMTVVYGCRRWVNQRHIKDRVAKHPWQQEMEARKKDGVVAHFTTSPSIQAEQAEVSETAEGDAMLSSPRHTSIAPAPTLAPAHAVFHGEATSGQWREIDTSFVDTYDAFEQHVPEVERAASLGAPTYAAADEEEMTLVDVVYTMHKLAKDVVLTDKEGLLLRAGPGRSNRFQGPNYEWQRRFMSYRQSWFAMRAFFHETFMPEVVVWREAGRVLGDGPQHPVAFTALHALLWLDAAQSPQNIPKQFEYDPRPDGEYARIDFSDPIDLVRGLLADEAAWSRALASATPDVLHGFTLMCRRYGVADCGWVVSPFRARLDADAHSISPPEAAAILSSFADNASSAVPDDHAQCLALFTVAVGNIDNLHPIELTLLLRAMGSLPRGVAWEDRHLNALVNRAKCILYRKNDTVTFTASDADESPIVNYLKTHPHTKDAMAIPDKHFFLSSIGTPNMREARFTPAMISEMLDRFIDLGLQDKERVFLNDLTNRLTSHHTKRFTPQTSSVLTALAKLMDPTSAAPEQLLHTVDHELSRQVSILSATEIVEAMCSFAVHHYAPNCWPRLAARLLALTRTLSVEQVVAACAAAAVLKQSSEAFLLPMLQVAKQKLGLVPSGIVTEGVAPDVPHSIRVVHALTSLGVVPVDELIPFLDLWRHADSLRVVDATPLPDAMASVQAALVDQPSGVLALMAFDATMTLHAHPDWRTWSQTRGVADSDTDGILPLAWRFLEENSEGVLSVLQTTADADIVVSMLSGTGTIGTRLQTARASSLMVALGDVSTTRLRELLARCDEAVPTAVSALVALAQFSEAQGPPATGGPVAALVEECQRIVSGGALKQAELVALLSVPPLRSFALRCCADLLWRHADDEEANLDGTQRSATCDAVLAAVAATGSVDELNAAMSASPSGRADGREATVSAHA